MQNKPTSKPPIGKLEVPAGQQPWDQLPGESSKRWAKFLIYKELGQKRSLDAAQSLCAGRKVVACASWRTPSQQFHWRERAEAWDAHMLALSTQKTEEVMLKMDAAQKDALAEYSQLIADIIRDPTNQKLRERYLMLNSLTGKTKALQMLLFGRKVFFPTRAVDGRAENDALKDLEFGD